MATEQTEARPAECCGACPPILGGGYDCTCAGNPRCGKTRKWLDECIEWAEADDLRPDAILFLQARIKTLVAMVRKQGKHDDDPGK